MSIRVVDYQIDHRKGFSMKSTTVGYGDLDIWHNLAKKEPKPKLARGRTISKREKLAIARARYLKHKEQFAEEDTDRVWVARASPPRFSRQLPTYRPTHPKTRVHKKKHFATRFPENQWG